MPPPRNRIDFQWKPHNSIDMAAIERMRENFPKPAKLPPQAWFMGGIDYFGEIDVAQCEWSQLEYYLFDTESGIRNFGRLRIWVEWFLYMLPDLILRSVKEEHSSLYEAIISYCFNVYQHEIYEEYLGFYADLFSTLMQVLMQSRFWQNNDIFAPCWTDPIEEFRPETIGMALEESMLFCIKYLSPQDISVWVKSITEIPGTQWQRKVNKWLRDFRELYANQDEYICKLLPAYQIQLISKETHMYSFFNS